MITLDEAIKHCEEVVEEQEKVAKEWHENQIRKCNLIPFAEMDYTHENECKECAEEHRQLAEWLKELKQLREQTSWIPMIRRESTDEEKDDYFAQHGEKCCYMLQNEMPLDGQEVLVSCGGIVSIDTFDKDYYDFESMSIEDVDAWMPLPKSYKAESEVEE